jgi:acyl-CoA synthetase (AMP-forming)/AMP-acid ligase II
MTDLISGRDWLRSVHHMPGRSFGAGPIWRSTIVGMLGRRAHFAPHASFLTQIGYDQPITYAQADHKVQCRAAALVASGLRRGGRVGVVGPTSIDFALAVLAILEAGGVAVLLSPDNPPRRTATQLDFAGADILLFDPACQEVAQACGRTRRLWSFDELERSSRPQEPNGTAPPAPTDAALVLFTSGTTGTPKAIVQSHYAVAQNAWALAEHHGIQPGTRFLGVLPLHHVNGLGFTLFAAMLGGGHTVLVPRFDTVGFWSLVRQHGIHIASLVPNLIRLLASRPGLRGEDPPTLRYAVSAAAPLSTQISREAWEGLRLRLVQGYGLSEVTNFSCLMPTGLDPAEYEQWMLTGRRTSVGPALPGQEVAIADGGRFVGPDIEGEIVIRGPSVMSGYLNDPVATDDALRGGWFHTGDLGYWLPGNMGAKYIHVSGRKREIAKRAGVLVSLLEVDEVLMSIDGVVDAGCASFVNTWVDEEIAAFVVVRPGVTLVVDHVMEICRAVLPFSAVPKRVEFVAEVPRTASGKVRRLEIADHFVGDREHLFVESKSTLTRTSTSVVRQVDKEVRDGQEE